MGCNPEQIAQCVGWRSAQMVFYYTCCPNVTASLRLLERITFNLASPNCHFPPQLSNQDNKQTISLVFFFHSDSGIPFFCTSQALAILCFVFWPNFLGLLLLSIECWASECWVFDIFCGLRFMVILEKARSFRAQQRADLAHNLVSCHGK